ncbi:MAG: STAS domain-containing protein [Aquincola sp.]|nr:STAS domain-containing protein [Aquincola sp.]
MAGGAVPQSVRARHQRRRHRRPHRQAGRAQQGQQVLTLALPAKLNIAEAGAAVAALAPQLASLSKEGSGPLVVDASALDDFDSSAIATLLELRRHAQGRAFSVRGAPRAMIELATLYGVADLLAFSG